MRATQDAFDKVEGEARSLSESIENTISILWNSITDIFDDLFWRIGGYLAGIGKLAFDIVGILGGIAFAISGIPVLNLIGLLGAIYAIGVALEDLSKLVGMLWDDFFAPIIDMGEASFNRIVDSIGTFANKVRGTFENMFDPWKGKIKELEKELTNYSIRYNKVLKDFAKSKNYSQFREDISTLFTDLQGLEGRIKNTLSSYSAGSQMRQEVDKLRDSFSKLESLVEKDFLESLDPPHRIKRVIEELNNEIRRGLDIISEGGPEALKKWITENQEAAKLLLDNEKDLHESIKEIIRSTLGLSDATDTATESQKNFGGGAVSLRGALMLPNVVLLSLIKSQGEFTNNTQSVGMALAMAGKTTETVFVPALQNAKVAAGGVGTAVANMAKATRQADKDTVEAGNDIEKTWRQQATEVSRTLSDMSGAFSAAADFAGVFDDAWAQALNNVASNISKVAQGLGNLTSENPLTQLSGVFQIASGIGGTLTGQDELPVWYNQYEHVPIAA